MFRGVSAIAVALGVLAASGATPAGIGYGPTLLPGQLDGTTFPHRADAYPIAATVDASGAVLALAGVSIGAANASGVRQSGAGLARFAPDGTPTAALVLPGSLGLEQVV